MLCGAPTGTCHVCARCVQVTNLQSVASIVTSFRDLVNSQYTTAIAALAGTISTIKTQVNSFLEPFKPIK